jgi:hypothetical protein
VVNLNNEYVKIRVKVLGEIHEARVQKSLTVERFITYISREFHSEIIDMAERDQNYIDETRHSLWMHNSVLILRPETLISDLDQTRLLVFGADDELPKLKPKLIPNDVLTKWTSQPIQDDAEFRLVMENGEVIRNNLIPVMLGRSPNPIEYPMQHIPFLEHHFNEPNAPELIKSVSREHAALIRQSINNPTTKQKIRLFFVIPVRPENPTFLNGVLLKYLHAYPLQFGDEITLGSKNFAFTFYGY